MESRNYQDIRVYRFRAPLFKRVAGHIDLQSVEFRSDGPIPIFNDSQKIIGFATLTDAKGFGFLECAIDPANPERLDLEIGAKRYWMDATLELRGFGFAPGKAAVAYVNGLTLTTTAIPDQEPIDPNLGFIR